METCNFFILGTPRCRTAWLTAFFQSDTTFCGHEFFSIPNHQVDVFWDIKGYRYKGSVDTNPLIATPYLTDLYAPLVIVERPLEEVVGSLIGLFGKEHKDIIYPYAEKLYTSLQSAKKYADLVVEFKDIDERLYEIFKTCCPTSRVNKYKLDTFKNYNVSCKGANFLDFKNGVEASRC